MTSLLFALLLAASQADTCHHDLATIKQPRVLALARDGTAIHDSVEVLKVFWTIRPDSCIAQVRCTKCRKFIRVGAIQTARQAWFDSVRAEINKIQKETSK